MKKLELKFGNVKEMLTKDQMKMISGGSYSCGYSGGGTVTYGGSYICGSQTSNCECQAFYDNVCSADPNCDDVDCGCK